MPDLEELLAEVVTGVRSFAYGPGAGMVLRLRRALISEAREAGRLREQARIGGLAVLELARLQGMLEEAMHRAAILRTESVYVPAVMARAFVAKAKELQEASLQALSPPTPDGGDGET